MTARPIRDTIRQPRCGIAVALLAGTLFGTAPAGAVSPAASILLFPRIVVDDAQDTMIQMTNVSNREAYARCTYIDASGGQAAQFELALHGQQTTHWVVSRGRPVDDTDPVCSRPDQYDCDGAGHDPGDVPPVAVPFAGALVCVQLDRSGAPLSGNALLGRATLDSADGDVAGYAAVGLLGLPANDADDVLCIDGIENPSCTAPEYSACPTQWELVHAADGAVDLLDPVRRVLGGTVTALPCALAFGGAPAALDVQITSTDELGQTLTATAPLAPLAATALRDLSPTLAIDAGGGARHTRLAADTGFALLAQSEHQVGGPEPAPAGRAAGGTFDPAGAAAVVTLPYLLVESVRGIDAVVRIANVSDQPLRARCAYEATTPTCSEGGAADSCLPGGSGCTGACVPNRSVVTFGLSLAAQQPLAWRVGLGLSQGAFPPLEAVEIPATSDPFLGVLRCAAVDAVGRPVDRNALVATASIETIRPDGEDAAADYIDAAQYDAVAQPAIAGAVDRDAFLVLGDAAEYAPCGAVLSLSHLFDGATLRTGTRADTVGTTLALAPCSADVAAEEPAGVVVQFLVYNEFRQRFSTSRAMSGQLVTPLSQIDTSDGSRSIFNAGIAGTLAGQTRMEAIGGGALGVAIEHHVGADGVRPHSAAIALVPEGTADFDVLAIGGGCVGDCNADGAVGIDELLRGVNIGLGSQPLGACPAFDNDGDGMVGVAELIQGVASSLATCPAGARPTPSPLPTPEAIPTVATTAPEVTYFGVVSGDDQPLDPVATDDGGRPIYAWGHGEGFAIVVEGRPGLNRRNVGSSAYVPGGAAAPDLQLIVDRPLGDGSEAICDADPPAAGGVPAAAPFAFDAPNALAVMNDFGCRTDNGAAMPTSGVNSGPCTRLVNFLAQRSTARFCVPVDHAWAFPSGDSTVAVRLRDVSGQVGDAQEIVVRVP